MTELTILVAHGSSDQNWSDTFVQMTQQARDQHKATRLAFMELSSPSIEEVVADAITEGYRTFNVLPLFLAKGKHLKKDIPAILTRLEEAHSINTHLLPPVGEHPELAAAINNIISKAMK